MILCAEGGVRILQSAAVDPASNRVGWPQGLRYVVIDTGVSASTPRLLETFFAWRDRASDAQQLMQQLVSCANAAAADWRSGDTQKVIAAIAGYSKRLDDMDKASGIGIFSQGHTDLCELAMRNRLAYKPSGAGGGDFGIAFGDDAECLADFAVDAAKAGFSPVDIKRSVDGVVSP